MFASSNLLYSTQGVLDLERYLPGLSTSGISPSAISSLGAHPTNLSHDVYPSDSLTPHGLPMSPEPYSGPSYQPVQSPPLQPPMPVEAAGQGTFRASKFMVEPGYQKPSTPYVMEDCKTDAMKS